MKKSKKPVEIVCVMDRSSSMAGVINESVDALNNFIKQQAAIPGKVRLTIVDFADKAECVLDRLKLHKDPAFQIDDKSVSGMTALYDAIGQGINRVDSKDNVIMLIQTDGGENSSKDFKSEEIKNLISDKQKKGWEFVFIGAGIDAYAASNVIGISKDNTVNVKRTAEGMATYSSTMSTRATNYREKTGT